MILRRLRRRAGTASCVLDGEGPVGYGSAMTLASTIDDAQLIETILEGSSGGGAIMPGLANQFDDQESADVVAYVRASFP